MTLEEAEHAADVIREDMATFQRLWRKYGGARLGLTESNYAFILRCFEEFINRQDRLDAKYDRLMATLTEAQARHDRMYDVINEIVDAQETKDLLASLKLEAQEAQLKGQLQALQENAEYQARPGPQFLAGYSAEHPPVNVGLVEGNGGSLRGVTAEGLRRQTKRQQVIG